MASSYSSSPRHGNEGDLDENDSLGIEEEKDYDTEDASETDQVKREEEFTGIKEQMYQDKLAQLKKQLLQLKEGTLPEYMKKLKKIEQQFKERIRINDIWYTCELELVEKDYIKEKKAAAREFEEKKIDLKENLLAELDEKRRQVDGERNTMELTGGRGLSLDLCYSMDVKPVTTRKLRRRPNDPIPMPEKRRKPSPDMLSKLNFCLSEDDIMDDIKIINKISGKPLMKKPQIVPTQASSSCDNLFDARIEDGRLYYDKRWFHRGQPVFLESKESGKVSGVITAVGTQEVWLRRTSDNGKVRIYISQLQKGKFALRRRQS